MKFNRNLIALVAASFVATASMAMQPAEYSTGKDRISADYKMHKEKCDALSGNAKDVCEKEAKGAEKVSRAELDAQYKPSEKAAYKVRKERADAAYEVSKEKCDDLSGNTKDVCKKDAKAAHVHAVENAKVGKAATAADETRTEKAANVAEARKDAAAEKRVEKCLRAGLRCSGRQCSRNHYGEQDGLSREEFH